MPLHPDFPTDPFAIIDPAVRWYPGEEQIGEAGLEKLIPPLVHRIRQGVTEWRQAGYPGVSDTTRFLLLHWFETEHAIYGDGSFVPFRWYFAQREAVESAIWLYEHEEARSAHALLRYDAAGVVAQSAFLANWPHYVMKLATGAGKTKVLSLLMIWSYFHALYEEKSPLSTNILLIAPNIIVLDRLRADFDGARIFYQDPLLPENGYEDRDWQADFQMNVHIQDQIGAVNRRGNLFLTNIHRVTEGPAPPSWDDEDVTDYFLGPKPVTKTTDSLVDLGMIVRQVDDLIVFNDEAHHIHEKNAWFENVQDIVFRMRQSGRRFAGQFDVTATPKHNNGSIFVNTISDYPLVEAIRQNVVKKPVVPDHESRAELVEVQSTDVVEQFRDHIDLGVTEWRKYQERMEPLGRKAVLFIMTEDTASSDRVAEHLRLFYHDLSDATFVIHTKKNGEIADNDSKQSKEELERLRKTSAEIDRADNPYKAIVSVMMLREGWDVQSVCVIVGLRAYNSKAKILPEQTLGRGLRRMFRGTDVPETVSVIGTAAFINFVEAIRIEGVELDEVAMGERDITPQRIWIEVDWGNPKKTIANLDIGWPILSERFTPDHSRIAALDIATLVVTPVPLRHFKPSEQKRIIFRHIDSQEISHETDLSAGELPQPENVIGYLANLIKSRTRMVSHYDVLFGKTKDFIETRLFGEPVSIDDPDVLRSLCEPATTELVFHTMIKAINALTPLDAGAPPITGVRPWHHLSQTHPYSKAAGPYIQSAKSVFNKVVCDNNFEFEFAALLENDPFVSAYAKNDQRTGFFVEYVNHHGRIAAYYPDFLVHYGSGEQRLLYVVETKGAEDLDVALKRARLRQWCQEASSGVLDWGASALFVDQARWDRHRGQIKDFLTARSLFADPVEPGT